MACQIQNRRSPWTKFSSLIRGWIESGYERRGECNLCGDCCQTIWMCKGMSNVGDPLDVPCETCGEGYYTQLEQVVCPYLDQDRLCVLYSPEAGLPFNCCKNFPQVKDILWNLEFYRQLPDCEFYLAKRKVNPLVRLRNFALLPFVWQYRLRHKLRKKKEAERAYDFGKTGKAAVPDPRFPLVGEGTESR